MSLLGVYKNMDDANKIEFKPCPFCGGKIRGLFLIDYRFIMCQKCKTVFTNQDYSISNEQFATLFNTRSH